MIKNCEGCEWEFEESIRCQDDEGLHLATSKEYEYDSRKHFTLILVNDEGKIIMN